MIRFALIVASVLGFALTAAVGNLLTPLLRALVPPEKENTPDPKPGQDPPEPSAPRGLPTMGGLCFIIGTLAAVGGNQTAAAKRLGISRTTLWRYLNPQKAATGKK